jgi:hypothetical protein
LQRISHGEPVVAEITIRGKGIRVEGRRLTPAEVREVQLVIERTLPPVLDQGKDGQEPRYDFRNPEYRKEAETCRRTARAMAIVFAYPMFRKQYEADGGKMNAPAEMMKWLEGRSLEDDLLDVLFWGDDGKDGDGVVRGSFLRRQLPARLAKYEFRKLLPEHLALPPPSEEYFEMEVAKA